MLVHMTILFLSFAMLLFVLGISRENLIYSILSSSLFFALIPSVAEIEFSSGATYNPPPAKLWILGLFGLISALNFLYLSYHDLKKNLREGE